MSEVDQESELNEFEYSEEELAELARLDALNEGNDELKTEPETEADAQKLAQIQAATDSEDGDDALINSLIDPKKLNDADIDPETFEQENGDDDQNQEPKAAEDPQPDPTPEADPQPEPEDDPEPEAEAPDFDAQLEDMEQQVKTAQGEVDDTLDQLKQLAEDFDNGEVSQGKYDIEKLQLERQLRRAEKTLEQLEHDQKELAQDAQTQIEAYRESRLTVWRNDLQKFIQDDANKIIAENPHIAQQFDTLLSSMGQSGVFEGLSNQQILASVRNQLAIRVPELAKSNYNPTQKPAEKPPLPKHTPKIQPSLSQMSAVEAPEDDPFAYIRKLSGVQYEQAISKLSEEDQERFFFG